MQTTATGTTLAPAPPEVSVELYRVITGLADSSPHWLRQIAEVGTEAGLAVFAVAFCVSWWRSRGAGARAVALALLAPVATGVAYLVSETAKSVIAEDRPCRTIAGVDPLAACPVPGDWSMPSNHATIAAAAVAAVALASRWLALAVAPVAALIAFSRVFVGVHYPHDVLAGLLVGAVAAPLVVVTLAPPATAVVARLREKPLLGPVLTHARLRGSRSR